MRVRERKGDKNYSRFLKKMVIVVAKKNFRGEEINYDLQHQQQQQETKLRICIYV